MRCGILRAATATFIESEIVLTLVCQCAGCVGVVGGEGGGVRVLRCIPCSLCYLYSPSRSRTSHIHCQILIINLANWCFISKIFDTDLLIRSFDKRSCMTAWNGMRSGNCWLSYYFGYANTNSSLWCNKILEIGRYRNCYFFTKLPVPLRKSHLYSLSALFELQSGRSNNWPSYAHIYLTITIFLSRIGCFLAKWQFPLLNSHPISLSARFELKSGRLKNRSTYINHTPKLYTTFASTLTLLHRNKQK